MNQTLSRRLHPLSLNADKGEYATGQYRGMLMRALALTAPTIGRFRVQVCQATQNTRPVSL
ncbi:hypothetical protein [Streptomyces niveus]|uniref:hypothetical protein n=1 Tax=Streptomyces niveus TaxID=193462 RepID=UPI0036D43C51